MCILLPWGTNPKLIARLAPGLHFGPRGRQHPCSWLLRPGVSFPRPSPHSPPPSGSPGPPGLHPPPWGSLHPPHPDPPEPPSLSPVCCLLDTCLEVICDLRILSQFCHAPPCPQGTAPPPPPRPKPALPCLRCRPWLGPTASCHVVTPGRDTVASDTCGGREGQERSLSCLLSSRLVSYRPTLRTSGPWGRRSFLRM